MTSISQGVHLITFIGIISCSPHVQVNMFSDLINMIGKTEDTLCNSNASVRSTTADEKSSPLLLSQYSFVMTAPSCEDLAINQNNMRNFNWSCFTTGSSESRDINWLFVDCVRSKMASVKCLPNSQVDQIVAMVCQGDQIRCKAFKTNDGQQHVCSNQFKIKSTLVEQNERVKEDARSFLSNMDIIACGCALFILVTFIISVCIPTEKCKPTYVYDDGVGLRVPLEIYELYGQHYKPSAMRKAQTEFNNSVGSIYMEAPHCHPFHTVAVIANPKMDPAPDRYNTKTTLSPTFLDTEMIGSYHESVFSDKITLIEDREANAV